LKEGENLPRKVLPVSEKSSVITDVNPALGPMGGRFTPSGEGTPRGKQVGQTIIPMELESPSPPMPQRRLKDRRTRVIRDEDSPETPKKNSELANGEGDKNMRGERLRNARNPS